MVVCKTATYTGRVICKFLPAFVYEAIFFSDLMRNHNQTWTNLATFKSILSILIIWELQRDSLVDLFVPLKKAFYLTCTARSGVSGLVTGTYTLMMTMCETLVHIPTMRAQAIERGSTVYTLRDRKRKNAT